jgi:hypothetical protein
VALIAFLPLAFQEVFLAFLEVFSQLAAQEAVAFPQLAAQEAVAHSRAPEEESLLATADLRLELQRSRCER